MSTLETNHPKTAMSGVTRWLVVAVVAGLLVLGVALALHASQTGAASRTIAAPIATATTATSAAPVASPARVVATPTLTADQSSQMGYLEQLTHEQDFCNCGH